jgi:chemotaxis methyl-accepting protein methylase
MTVIDDHVADLLLRTHNFDVSGYDPSFLKKSMQKRAVETGCGSLEEYCAFLEQNEMESTLFIDSLQISYSKFFRNPLTFAVLERIVLPALVLKKIQGRQKEIRVWSAACAGGEETYTLAILLEELRNCSEEKFMYRIFATDQSEAQVQEAAQGEYVAADLNNLSLKRAGEWFTRQGELYAVKPELKKHIDFSIFDLLNEDLSCPQASIFGDFDLVVCANLLFYYKTGQQKTIVAKTGNCLAKNGYLLTGEAERDIVMRYNYQELFPQSAIFKRILP